VGYKGSFIIEVDELDAVKEIKKSIKEQQKQEDIGIQEFSFPKKWLWFWRVLLIVLVFALVVRFMGAYFSR
jgi:hypothetical protein